jgi:isopenicillin-N N-acyltransferase-like protein
MMSQPPLPLPHVAVAGTPAEYGNAYGAAARDLVAANLEVYRRRFRDQAGLDAAALAAAGATFREVTAALHPRIAAALDGVAAGARVPVPEIYALNARTELLYGTAQRPPAAGADGGCTAIGVLGTHTATGHLLMGQNWDWSPDQRGAMLLLETTDERGHRVLTLAEAGMFAKTGLNSAGLGMCLTMLASDADGLAAGRPPGVPYHVLARAVLEADCLAWATRSACRSPRNASINLLIGEAGDPAHGDPAAGGELIDLEVVPGHAGWLHPAGGMITHANHLETPLPVHDVQQDWGGSSLYRAARARRLLAEAAEAAKVTTDDLVAVFRDHAGFPHGICRHVDARDVPLERSETVYSVLLDVDAGRLGIAAGPPCAHGYAWLSLPA